jgi:uncharacterized cupredoxin-like copper-binding protein
VLLQVGDDLQFEPATVGVTQGETVAFVVTNAGSVPRLFVIGGETVQAEHDAGMTEAERAGMSQAERPHMIEVAAGETATLVYRFDQSGSTLFGWHVPGDGTAGTRGAITVHPSHESDAST